MSQAPQRTRSFNTWHLSNKLSKHNHNIWETPRRSNILLKTNWSLEPIFSVSHGLLHTNKLSKHIPIHSPTFKHKAFSNFPSNLFVKGKSGNIFIEDLEFIHAEFTKDMVTCTWDLNCFYLLLMGIFHHVQSIIVLKMLIPLLLAPWRLTSH